MLRVVKVKKNCAPCGGSCKTNPATASSVEIVHHLMDGMHWFSASLGPDENVGTLAIRDRILVTPDGRRYMAVNGISVKKAFRRHGIGTQLYEAAAAYLGKNDLYLASDTMLSKMSGGFWDKQEGKGRANSIGTGYGNKRYVMKQKGPIKLNPKRRAKTDAELFHRTDAELRKLGRKPVEVYDAKKAGLDVGAKYAVSCNRHGTLLGTSSLKKAFHDRDHPWQWCEDCHNHKVKRNPSDAELRSMERAAKNDHVAAARYKRELARIGVSIESSLDRYVRKLNHPAKRAFAHDYLQWVYGTRRQITSEAAVFLTAKQQVKIRDEIKAIVGPAAIEEAWSRYEPKENPAKIHKSWIRYFKKNPVAYASLLKKLDSVSLEATTEEEKADLAALEKALEKLKRKK